MRDVLGKMRECGKYVKMRDFPHDCVMVDTYGILWFILYHPAGCGGSLARACMSVCRCSHNEIRRERYKKTYSLIITSFSCMSSFMDRGQPSIYFHIDDHHVNVSWGRSHIHASGVIATSHIVASHITKLLLIFRQILRFRFRENPQGSTPPPCKVVKTKPFLSM